MSSILLLEVSLICQTNIKIATNAVASYLAIGRCVSVASITASWVTTCASQAVADSGGVRGVQMHPPLAASNVFLRK